MMMRGSKEQHDELFKQIDLEKVSETSQGLQKSCSRSKDSETSLSPEGGDFGRASRESIAQARLLYPDSHTTERMSTKARCRFDSRIGGWRRVY